eukprot:scaffold884_cov398-Prasinococcus_capsulatus_cf.AAC.10
MAAPAEAYEPERHGCHVDEHPVALRQGGGTWTTIVSGGDKERVSGTLRPGEPHAAPTQLQGCISESCKDKPPAPRMPMIIIPVARTLGDYPAESPTHNPRCGSY